MTAPGQLDLDGGEREDPRQEQVAKALWWNDARRTWARDGEDVAREQARKCWPTVRGSYMATAAIALNAADKV